MDQQKREGPLGFYDPKSKLFYSVPNEEVYRELMNMFRQNPMPKDLPATQCSIPSDPVDLDKIYSDMVDRDIEEVYNDPLFTREIQHPELKEYDFWYLFLHVSYVSTILLNEHKYWLKQLFREENWFSLLFLGL